MAVRLAAVVVLMLARAAAAQDYPPIMGTDYAIDLYQGAVLGSAKIVGMGGASVALAEGAAGMTANPAAPAIRPATSRRRWDWDWNLDWLNPELGVDYDNNGGTATGVDRTLLLTGGLVGRYGPWGLGASFAFQRFIVDIEGSDQQADPQLLIARVTLARTFARLAATAGVGIRSGAFSIGLAELGTRTQNLFEITGSSIEAGAVWHPADRDVRLGLSAGLPVRGDQLTVEGCNPLDCHDFVLPERVVVPWQIGAGIAWRLAASRWNRTVPTRWRDERALVLAADVLVTGAVADGHGMEGFIDQVLQPSGRNIAVSVRAGADWEWRPGRLRVRGGSYWEPSRFTGVPGRLHVTAGFDLRLWSFCFWGERYRSRVSLTGDYAERYGNAAVSIGLWH